MNLKNKMSRGMLFIGLTAALVITPLSVQAERHNGHQNHGKTKISHSKSRHNGGYKRHHNPRKHHRSNHRRVHKHARSPKVRTIHHHGHRHPPRFYYPNWSYSIHYQLDDFLSIGFHHH